MGGSGSINAGGQFYSDEISNLGGAAVTTLTTMNAGTTAAAGSYSCKAAGFLQKVTIKISGQAASSLAQSGYVQLTCTKWKVNTHTFPFNGFGLLTAPQLIGGNLEDTITPPPGDGFLNLPVEPALTILPQIIYFFSPVTPNAVVVGLFSAS